MTSGAILSRTPSLGLAKLRFNFPNWGDEHNRNMELVDAALQSIGVAFDGAWDNDTSYPIGAKVIDPDDATFWRALVAHTSPISGTFAEARVAEPSHWEAIINIINFRGEWTTATAYQLNDIVFLGVKWAIAVTNHTSDTTFDADVSAGNLEIFFDATDVIAETSGHKNDAEAAALSASTNAGLTAADVISTNADAIATAADRVQTGLDAVATAADRVQTGLDAAATDADAIATAADRVQTGLDVIASAASASAALISENNAAAILAGTVTKSPTSINLSPARFIGTDTSLIGPGEVLAPPEITADQNNYAPTGIVGASVMILTSNARRRITGLGASGLQREMTILNGGSHPLVLAHETGSTSGFRFAIGMDIELFPGDAVTVKYLDSRWRLRNSRPARERILAQAEAAGDAALVFSLNPMFDKFLLDISRLSPSVDGADGLLEVSNDGSTWISTNYRFSGIVARSETPASLFNTDTNPSFQLAPSHGNGAGRELSGTVVIMNRARPRFFVNTGFGNAAGNLRGYMYVGQAAGASAGVSHIRVRYDSGNVASGRATLVGIGGLL